jgi:hypothetical protein
MSGLFFLHFNIRQKPLPLIDRYSYLKYLLKMNKTPEELTVFFQSLSEKEKLVRYKKVVNLLLIVGKGHVELLSNHHQSDVHKEIGFAYFFHTVESLWENVEFSISLGEGKFGHLNFYPARLIAENVFRLEYYIQQTKEKQNEICLLEMTRVMKKFYDAFGDVAFKEQYEKVYKELGEVGKIYPSIEEKSAYQDPFPNTFDLIQKSKLPQSEGFYKIYQYLCEAHHGKLLSLYMAKHSSQFGRNLSIIFLLSKWTLIITDSHIHNKTKSLVDEVIEKATQILFDETAVTK